MTVANMDIPQHVRENIAQALSQRAAALVGKPMLRSLLTFLDNRLEDLLAMRPIQMVQVSVSRPDMNDSGTAPAIPLRLLLLLLPLLAMWRVQRRRMSTGCTLMTAAR